MNINPWHSTSVKSALEGRSFIDAKRIHIHSLQEAHEFLECYGFDLDDPLDIKEIEVLRLEAIALIQEELLLDDEEIPQAIIEQTDLRQHLLNASGRGAKELKTWSGAILKVLHSLTHSYSYLNDIYHHDIRDQIFGRFDGHLIKQESGFTLGSIKLLDAEFREAKSKRSVAMKLMHKPENVAADIFDWIGVRFITEYRADVLNILAYLREKHIITYANIKPSRSRNTLINLEWINQCFDKGMNIDEIRQAMQLSSYPSTKIMPVKNQFSEMSYHSVQITCRQRVKIKQENGKNLCFYFPFELQLMDQESFLKTHEGLASHGEYKKRQRKAVRQRILPFLRG